MSLLPRLRFRLRTFILVVAVAGMWLALLMQTTIHFHSWSPDAEHGWSMTFGITHYEQAYKSKFVAIEFSTDAGWYSDDEWVPRRIWRLVLFNRELVDTWYAEAGKHRTQRVWMH